MNESLQIIFFLTFVIPAVVIVGIVLVPFMFVELVVSLNRSHRVRDAGRACVIWIGRLIGLEALE